MSVHRAEYRPLRDPGGRQPSIECGGGVLEIGVATFAVAGQTGKIRTAIHNIRAAVIEFPEPLRNRESLDDEFSRGKGCHAFLSTLRA
jgi:hypothetical protein